MIEREYDIGGALTFWALVPTPYQAFKDVLESRGYGKCVPNPRTDQSALQGAIKSSGWRSAMARLRPARAKACTSSMAM